MNLLERLRKTTFDRPADKAAEKIRPTVIDEHGYFHPAIPDIETLKGADFTSYAMISWASQLGTDLNEVNASIAGSLGVQAAGDGSSMVRRLTDIDLLLPEQRLLDLLKIMEPVTHERETIKGICERVSVRVVVDGEEYLIDVDIFTYLAEQSRIVNQMGGTTIELGKRADYPDGIIPARQRRLFGFDLKGAPTSVLWRMKKIDLRQKSALDRKILAEYERDGKLD